MKKLLFAFLLFLAAAVPRERAEMRITAFLLFLAAAVPLSVLAASVNINTATAVELEGLSGIGPAKAEAIVKDREANGPFASVEDLTRVSGIGEKTVEKLSGQITAE